MLTNHSMTKDSVNYANAEVRGRVRQWKKQLAHDYNIFDRAYKALDMDKSSLVRDMVMCTKSGREQAFRKIHRSFGPGVTLESVSLGKRNNSLAIWSILKPRRSVIKPREGLPEARRLSLAQDCVSLNFILVGCVNGKITASEGLWTLEVPDHALGRAVERSRLPHPGSLIRDAHLTLLNLPHTVLDEGKGLIGAYIKAGPGCFVGDFRMLKGKKNFGAHVRVVTWLDEDQLFENQIILSEKGEPGERLGDSWLQPSPLCRCQYDEKSKEMTLSVWSFPKKNLDKEQVINYK